MEWNKFPDVKPKDGELVLLKECSISDGRQYHHCDLYFYDLKTNCFHRDQGCCGDQDFEFYDKAIIYWKSIPECPCGKDEN